MRGLRTYLETLGYLRPIQVAARLRRGVTRAWPGPPSTGVALRGFVGIPPVMEVAAWSEFGFSFLNSRIPFTGNCRWDPPEASRLWVYNLHYFRYLWSMPPAEAVRLIEDWINLNPPGSRPGWEPYPIALRLREWSDWTVSQRGLDRRVRERVASSLDQQLAHLLDQVEYEHLANHLLEDAIGLCWAGLRLSSPMAVVALGRGAGLLQECLDEQLLGDGCHDERSPMYQASIAESLLRLSNVAADVDAGRAGLEIGTLAARAAVRLAESLSALVHPDGEIALLNDSALGVAPRPADLLRSAGLGTAPRPGLRFLGDAGYASWRGGEGTFLVLDCGEIGPAHNTAHSHADMLSFEMSHRGVRVFTDTGVHTYDPGPVRSYDRSTRAHNTLEVDGLSQADLWAAFRCGRRGSILGASAHGRDGGFELMGSVEYPGKGLGTVRHERRIRGNGQRIEFEDLCHADGRHSAVLRLHVAPGIEVRDGGEKGIELLRGGETLMSVTGPAWQVSESPYHPRYGVEHLRPCLSTSWEFMDSTRVRWALEALSLSPLKERAPSP